jgi:hypothetical protein
MVLKKFYEEGSRSPFVARLFFGILNLRDGFIRVDPLLHDSQNRVDHFDKLHEPVLLSLMNSREAAKIVIKIIQDHNKYLLSLHPVNGQLSIEDSIDIKLSKEIKSFVIEGTNSTKDYLQKFLLEIFDINIGCVFMKDDGFHRGIAKMESIGQIPLANYLTSARNNWLSSLINLRNDIEHNGYIIQQVNYQLGFDGIVRPEYPKMLGLSPDKFVRKFHNHMCLFEEDLISYGFFLTNHLPIYLSEIPKLNRNPKDCQKFTIEPKGMSNKPSWKLEYSETTDFL